MLTKPCAAWKGKALLMLMYESNRSADWTKFLLLHYGDHKNGFWWNYQVTLTTFVYALPPRGIRVAETEKKFPKGKTSVLFVDLRKFTTTPFKTFRHLTFFCCFFLISFTFLIKSKKQTKKYIDVLNRTPLCKVLTKQINIEPDKRNGAANSNIIYYEALIYVCICHIWVCGYMCVHLCMYTDVNICLHTSHTHIYTDLFRLKSKALFTMNRLKPLT